VLPTGFDALPTPRTMKTTALHRPVGPAATDLRAFLLGTADFEAALRLQHALIQEIAGEGRSPALVLCEHPPLITVGRHGSPGHIRFSAEELEARRWRVRWVNRGGGCLLHLPGQLAAYPIVPLDRLGLGVEAYLELLQRVVIAVLDDFGAVGETKPGRPGVWVGGRLIANVGVAVSEWVAYHGVALNVHPDLTPFRLIQTGPPDEGPMTSLARERHGALRPALVRQRFLEHFSDKFNFKAADIYFSHPALAQDGAETVSV
jgi:lipoyl(octanoyl) transferase